MQNLLHKIPEENTSHSEAHPKTEKIEIPTIPSAPAVKKRKKLPRFSIPFRSYLGHLPALFMSFIFYGLMIFIFIYIDPKSIENTPVPHLYFPLLTTAFLGDFFFFSFLFLNSRKGFLTALVLTSLLFVRLQHILSFPVVLVTAILFIFVELLLTIPRQK
jgi:hypothetical protein